MNEVMKCLLSRRSCKNYLPRQIPEEALEEILQAGMYAANGRGLQSPRIVVVQAPEDRACLEKLNGEALGNPEAHPFYGAPTVCVVLADPEVHTWVEDGALVIGNMLAAAHSLGLGACWIHRAREEFDSPAGKALLKKWGVEGNLRGVGHCILGYPAGPCKEAAKRKEKYITRV